MVCLAPAHLYSEWFGIQVSLEVTQNRLYSGTETQSVSRELFAFSWASALRDWPQPEETGFSLRCRKLVVNRDSDEGPAERAQKRVRASCAASGRRH